MSLETDIILKQLLLQILKAGSLAEAQNAIKFLCSKEDIAEAEKIIRETKQDQ
jgi:hypothetical protein